MQMTDKTTNLLLGALNDLEEPFSPVLEQTATSVTGCLTNVLTAGASQADGASDETQSSSKVVYMTAMLTHQRSLLSSHIEVNRNIDGTPVL